jgi:hypothetical protein
VIIGASEPAEIAAIADAVAGLPVIFGSLASTHHGDHYSGTK